MTKKKQQQDGAAYLVTCPDCAPYPETFPTSCFGPLIAALRGQIDDLPCVIHCGWTVTGWGLGTFFADDHVHGVGEGASAPAMTSEEAAAALEDLAASGDVAKAGAVNWMAILAVVLKLLTDWLKK